MLEENLETKKPGERFGRVSRVGKPKKRKEKPFAHITKTNWMTEYAWGAWGCRGVRVCLCLYMKRYNREKKGGGEGEREEASGGSKP